MSNSRHVSLPKTIDLDGAYDPGRVEEGWYTWWADNGYFHADETSDKEPYTIVIPPPNVTGSLHMGHALTMTIQDILIRWHRMRGHEALWLPGTDHAGISTQVMVERMLKKDGITRHDLGRDAFLERVWEWKEKHGGRITEQLRVLGSSLDWERERFTMDAGLSAAVREVFVSLWEEGLIYRAERLVNWDPAGQTVLSDLEVEQEEEAGYLWHISYPLTDDPSRTITVATTRPETMLGDTAVAVHPDDERYRDLIGKTLDLPLTDRKIPIVADGLVADPAFGSGAVKITPAHDFNDWECGVRNGLEVIQVIGIDAKVTDRAPAKYRGMDRYDARTAVVEDLKAAGRIEKIEDYTFMPGRSQRTGEVVEPLPMLQWWVKMQPLADPAIAAVQEGKIEFIPETWSKVYFEWMNNIRDWCISRQLWWGHRIPAWHCSACGGVTVSRQDATACGECGSDHIAQDPDVLDTWFSSALWPFSTMGWPEKTETLAKFYPTTVMETGFDIIFFWVARMIFMGIHFMGEVPFRTVFLHAMVRDKEGQKMSKTKGNVVDPLHVIQGVIPGEIDPEERDNYGTLFKDFPEGVPPQGADALRITLAKYAAQGRDIKLDVKRVEGDRAFLNKLWNATKFALTHLEGWEPRALDVDKESLTPADRWILGRLQIAAEQVMSALGDFRINDAAHTIYGFFWHEFCDWYLELSKPVLYGRPEAAEVGGDAEGSKTVMAHVLETSLRLLHPIAPYITEQLWHALPSMAATQVTPSISLAPWPEAIEAHRFAEATADVELAIEVITAIRAIRGQTGVKPGVVIEELMLFSDGPVQRAEIARTDTYIRNLARVGRITMSASEGVERPNKTATAVVSGLELQIPLAGLIDVAEETARLTKELAKVEEDLKHVGGKLTNPKFMERAPDAVVNKEREKQREFITLKAALLASLEELQELG